MVAPATSKSQIRTLPPVAQLDRFLRADTYAGTGWSLRRHFKGLAQVFLTPSP
jgi:hypothetical protein